MATDYTPIIGVRQQFGNEPGVFAPGEQNVPFVGATKKYQFSCPNVDPGIEAVLMFQTRGVTTNKNIFQINGQEIFGGLPVSPNDNEWNGNIMLVSKNVLKATGNVLHIEARNSSGTSSGNLDDFIIDNVVVLYKTR